MLRNKKGVHNSFNSPDSINELDWTNLQRYPQVFAYYKNLIQLRKNHPAFRLSKTDLVREHLRFLETPDCVVAFELHDLQGIDPWQHIIVVLNANREAKSVRIPDGNYTVVACDGTIDEQSQETLEGGNVTVDPQSALILRQ